MRGKAGCSPYVVGSGLLSRAWLKKWASLASSCRIRCFHRSGCSVRRIVDLDSERLGVEKVLRPVMREEAALWLVRGRGGGCGALPRLLLLADCANARASKSDSVDSERCMAVSSTWLRFSSR